MLDGLKASDWGPEEGRTIDTRSPFRLHAHFKQDAAGEFAALKISLEQAGRTVSFTVSPGVWQTAQISTLGSVGRQPP